MTESIKVANADSSKQSTLTTWLLENFTQYEQPSANDDSNTQSRLEAQRRWKTT